MCLGFLDSLDQNLILDLELISVLILLILLGNVISEYYNLYLSIQ